MDEACGTVIHQWSCLIGCPSAGLVISIIRTLVNVTEARKQREGPAVSATPFIYFFHQIYSVYGPPEQNLYNASTCLFFIYFDLKLIVTKLVNVWNICNLWHEKCCTFSSYCYGS